MSAVAALAVVGTVSFLAARASGPEEAAPLVRPNPATDPFEGLGVWVDIYDTEAWNDPARAVEMMAANGVRTLYLQSSNADRIGPFVSPRRDRRLHRGGARPRREGRGLVPAAPHRPAGGPCPHPRRHLVHDAAGRSLRRVRARHRVGRGTRPRSPNAAARRPLASVASGGRRPLSPRGHRALAGAAGGRRRVLARLPVGGDRAHIRCRAAHDLLHVPRAWPGRDATAT